MKDDLVDLAKGDLGEIFANAIGAARKRVEALSGASRFAT